MARASTIATYPKPHGKAFGRRDADGVARPEAVWAIAIGDRAFGTRPHFRVRTAADIAGSRQESFAGALVAPGVALALGVAATGLSQPAYAQATGDDAVLVAQASTEPPMPTEIDDGGAGAEPTATQEAPQTATKAAADPAMPAPIDDTSGNAAALPVDATAADASPTAAAFEQLPTARELFLDVFINGKATDLIGNFKETPDGGLVVEPGELEEVGIKADIAAIGSDGLVRMDKLPDVTFYVDEDTQRLYVTTTIEGRAVRDIDLGPRMGDDERLKPVSGYGAVLNYNLYATTGDVTEGKNIFEGISGNFDARVFSPFGTISQGFLTGYTNGELNGFTRLNTTWSYSDAKRLITYRAGDIVSGGLSWTRPVYLGGLQAQRNFHLRSDLVTMPLPSFEGTAAVPSTLEIYTQNVKTYSGDVGEGPFRVDNLPVVTGSGEARVVLRDSTGRESEVNLPFYSSSNMLAKGLLDFSADLGFARRGFGTESFDYDDRIMGVFTARYGLTDSLTVEGHAEGGADLVNGGVGAIFPLAGFGVGSVAVAGSYNDGEAGMLVNASAEVSYNDWSVYVRSQRTFGDYRDIASITADTNDVTVPGELPLFSAEVPRAIDQVAITPPPLLDMSSLSLSYTHVEDQDGDESHIVGLSYSQQFNDKISAYASAFADLADTDQFGVFAGVSVSFSNGYSASSGVDYSRDGVNFAAEASKAETLETGGYGWRVRTSEGKNPQRSASGSYRASFARFEAGVDQFDDEVMAHAQADGSIAVAGGGIFAGPRIDDAFAVVDVGAPDVEVKFQNRPVGKSNRRGKLLVTGLNSYEPNTLSIDPANLPVDAVVASTKDVVMPAGQSGVVVDFGVKENANAALVSLVDDKGQPLQAGWSGSLEGADDFVVGYDGEAYITGLSARNTVTVKRDDGTTCTASFPYKASRGEQVTVRGVKCL